MSKKPKHVATTVVLDVGKGMDGTGGGGGPSYLEQALEAVAHLVEQKILHPAASKKEYVSVVLFGTKETLNPLSDIGYERVYVLREMGFPDVKLLCLLNDISPGEREGDFIDAMIVGLDILLGFEEDCKKSMFLITGGYSKANTADVDRLKGKFRESEVGLNVIGANFWEGDDEDTRAVPDTKKANEKLLLKFLSSVDGRFYTMEEGLKLLSEYRTKTVRQVPTYNGTLDIGNVRLAVKMFAKAKKSTFPTMKKISTYSQMLLQQNLIDGVEEEDERDHKASLAVNMDRTYVGVIEPDKQFLRNDLVRGFRYGRSIVSFTAEDVKLSLKYKAPQCMTILGFVTKAAVPRHFFMSNAEVLVAADGDDVSAKGIASLCRALLPEVAKKEEGGVVDAQERVALVRLVKQKSGGAPKLACLIPFVKKGKYYGLYCHRLPFAEDLRQFEFPGLDRAHLVRENVMPTPEQLKAMADLIHIMDLDHAGPDGTEMLKPKETYNPAILNLYEAMRFRATKVPVTVGNVVDPACVQFLPRVDDRPPMTIEEARALPPVSNQVHQVLEPPKHLWDSLAGRAAITECKKQFELVPQEPKQNNKRKAWDNRIKQVAVGGVDLTSYRGGAAPQGGDGVNADIVDKNEPNKRDKKDPKLKMTLNQLLHGGTHIEEVGSLNPVEDFRLMLQRRDKDVVDIAISQMQSTIRKLVRESVMGHFYSKAIECLAALREGCVKEIEAEAWNTFLMQLRNECKDGPHTLFWQEVIRAKLTLIHEEESAESTVTRADALKFLQDDHVPDAVEQMDLQQENEDEENLFEMME